MFLLYVCICMYVYVHRGGLGQKFSPGIFCPDQPTTLSALGVGRDERDEPCTLLKQFNQVHTSE